MHSLIFESRAGAPLLNLSTGRFSSTLPHLKGHQIAPNPLKSEHPLFGFLILVAHSRITQRAARLISLSIPAAWGVQREIQSRPVKVMPAYGCLEEQNSQNVCLGSDKIILPTPQFPKRTLALRKKN